MRFRDEERGAVLAIVAISLVALIGMLVLTFDLGRGVALKRNMVNAADAGALAAARECGLANGPGPAETAARQLIVDNNAQARLTNISFDSLPQCSGVPADGERQVTVTVSVDQEYFFAQIFGFTGGTVTASATAEYTTGMSNPAPLRLDDLKVDQCLKQGDTPPFDGLVDCYFTFEKGPAPLNSDWGWLNLPEGWPIKGQDPNPKTCTTQKGGSNDLNDYIGTMGGMGTPGKELRAALWDPSGGGNPATYVCGSTGHKSTSVQAIQAWVANVKAEMAKDPQMSEPGVLFPVVACDPTKPLADSTCRTWKYTPGVAYPVVNLKAFFVKGAWDRPKIPPQERPNCKFVRPSSDSFCVHLQASLKDIPTSGGNPKVWLVR